MIVFRCRSQSKTRSCSVVLAERQGDGKLRTLAYFALDADFAAEQINESLDDSQPESGPAVFSSRRHVHLAELIEDIMQGVFVHADSGVGNSQLQRTVL